MGRPTRYDEAAILEAARQAAATLGPQGLTIAAVARQSGAPVGSIYHRYASRDQILAVLWLDLVERFQERFLAALKTGEPVEAGLAAVRHVCPWVRRHPREARLLLLHRREDFASARWPASHRRRAQALTRRAQESLGNYAGRLCGRADEMSMRRVRFALVDLPTAALRRDVEASAPPSKRVEHMLLDTCAYALRQAARQHTLRRNRR